MTASNALSPGTLSIRAASVLAGAAALVAAGQLMSASAFLTFAVGAASAGSAALLANPGLDLELIRTDGRSSTTWIGSTRTILGLCWGVFFGLVTLAQAQAFILPAIAALAGLLSFRGFVLSEIRRRADVGREIATGSVVNIFESLAITFLVVIGVRRGAELLYSMVAIYLVSTLVLFVLIRPAVGPPRLSQLRTSLLTGVPAMATGLPFKALVIGFGFSLSGTGEQSLFASFAFSARLADTAFSSLVAFVIVAIHKRTVDSPPTEPGSARRAIRVSRHERIFIALVVLATAAAGAVLGPGSQLENVVASTMIAGGIVIFLIQSAVFHDFQARARGGLIGLFPVGTALLCFVVSAAASSIVAL